MYLVAWNWGKITTYLRKQRDKGNTLGEETIPVHCCCRMREIGAVRRIKLDPVIALQCFCLRGLI